MTLNTRENMMMNQSKLYHKVLSLLINDPAEYLQAENRTNSSTTPTTTTSARKKQLAVDVPRSSSLEDDSTESSHSSVADEGEEGQLHQEQQDEDDDEEEENDDVQEPQDELSAHHLLSRLSLHEEHQGGYYSQQQQSCSSSFPRRTPTAATATSSLLSSHTLTRKSAAINHHHTATTSNRTTKLSHGTANSSPNLTNASKYSSCPQLLSSRDTGWYYYNGPSGDTISSSSNAEYAKWLQKELSREGLEDEDEDGCSGGDIIMDGTMRNADWGTSGGGIHPQGSLIGNTTSSTISSSSRKNAAWGAFQKEMEQYSYRTSHARDFGSTSNTNTSSGSTATSSLYASSSLMGEDCMGSIGGGLGNNTTHHHHMSTTSLDRAERRRNRTRNLYGLTASIRE
jgi:hypothetical protein